MKKIINRPRSYRTRTVVIWRAEFLIQKRNRSLKLFILVPQNVIKIRHFFFFVCLWIFVLYLDFKKISSTRSFWSIIIAPFGVIITKEFNSTKSTDNQLTKRSSRNNQNKSTITRENDVCQKVYGTISQNCTASAIKCKDCLRYFNKI